MTNTLLSIFCALSLVALAKPKQVNTGLQTFDETYSPSNTQKINTENEDYKQVFILYLTPSEIKALSNSRGTVNASFQIEVEKEQKQSDIQNYNQQQLNANKQDNKMYSPDLELKAELRGLLSHNSFYPYENNFKNQPWSYDFSKVVTEQMPKENERQINYSDLNKNQPRFSSQENQRNLQQENALNKQFEWKPSNPDSAIEKKVFKYDQLKQQWNNIAYQNPSHIKYSSYQNQNTKETNVENNNDKSIAQNYNEEKSEVEKQIESIVKQQQAAEDNRQNAFAQAEADSKKLPIFIQKEVSITRHLPVPVLKKVKIPTPVLVPIPEPYEVRIPHPYPVPYKIIKHIPIPVVKNY